MSSVAVSRAGIRNCTLYSGFYAAIEGFIRSFVEDNDYESVTVNMVVPGGIWIDIFKTNSWHMRLTG